MKGLRLEGGGNLATGNCGLASRPGPLSNLPEPELDPASSTMKYTLIDVIAMAGRPDVAQRVDGKGGCNLILYA
jgi:hypothetical protein